VTSPPAGSRMLQLWVPARHRHHRRAASCARTRHAVTFRSQAKTHLFDGNAPPWGLGHSVQRAERSSHRMGNNACAGELNRPAMPMRVIARKKYRAMVATPERTMFLQSARRGRVGFGHGLFKRREVGFGKPLRIADKCLIGCKAGRAGATASRERAQVLPTMGLHEDPPQLSTGGRCAR
jgi:hypothetical protein